MFYKAGPLIFRKAAELRNDVTPAEMALWGYLRTRPLGFKFRRQHPINNFIVDFFCFKAQLIIEVDGSIHEIEVNKKEDEDRQQHLESLGLDVLRFKNQKVLMDLEKVKNVILSTLSRKSKTQGDLTPPLGGWGA